MTIELVLINNHLKKAQDRLQGQIVQFEEFLETYTGPGKEPVKQIIEFDKQIIDHGNKLLSIMEDQKHMLDKWKKELEERLKEFEL